MKRKDLEEEEVNDDFLDFTLSSPALKIRRLNADLDLIIDEEKTMKPDVYGQSVPFQETFVEQSVEQSSLITIDELSTVPGNEERAIVLFNPKNSMPSLQSRLPFSISIDSDFVSGFKNPIIWSNRSSAPNSLVDEIPKQNDDKSEPTDEYLAVVPWAPNHSQHPPSPEAEVPGAQAYETMDADLMDVEDEWYTKQIPKAEYGVTTTSVREDLNQWQPHCMVPQPPSNHFATSMITWFGRIG